MRIFQIGAAGGIGLRLAQLLSARGDKIIGMHRRSEQAERLAAAGATPLRGDLIEDDATILAALMKGCDAVVFSAGAHGTGVEQTTLIDGEGLKKAVAAAALAGIDTFVLVSAFPESERSSGGSKDFEHYMAVKKSADEYLARTRLRWLIVRPGSLTDQPGSSTVTAALATDYGPVSRDNVAAFIASALHDPALRRIIVELVDGPNPVGDAVADLASFAGNRPDPDLAPAGS
ncbi:NAD(P)H-binding protein [Paeniglutamicibacter sp.]|uniref:NAD(P)H-binding protein n=1 Tax=Paeniglutamicibacter sp. TaxID=1934391 RepID=UPI003989BE7B